MSRISAHGNTSSEDENSSQFSSCIGVGTREINWEKFISAFPSTNISGDDESDHENQRNNELGEFLMMKQQNQHQLQTAIQIVENECGQDIGAETQVIVDNMENQAQASITKVSRKRKNVAKKNTTPSKKIPKVLPDPPADSFLGLLELMWTTNVYKAVMENLKYGEQKAMLTKDLCLKWEFTNLISLWKTVLKLIIHKLRQSACDDLSWSAFKTILSDSELYTTCLQFKMSDTETAIFYEYANKEAVPVVPSKGPSSSCVTTPTTTSTSCTTAPTTETVANASASKKSEQNVGTPDLIEDFFGLQNVQASIGSISQSILKQANGKQYILKSPGECGLTVVKLETYPFAKICGLDKKNWWKHAETKMVFLTTSNVDPVQMQLNKLQNSVMKEITKLSGITKEVKEINYWNSFGGFPHRQ